MISNFFDFMVQSIKFHGKNFIYAKLHRRLEERAAENAKKTKEMRLRHLDERARLRRRRELDEREAHLKAREREYFLALQKT